MKKSLLSLAVAALALNAFAADPAYNFFDPADCDADGWLWLDTQEKIDKYVGKGLKIQLVQAQYEVEDPEFPGEYLTPDCSVSPDFKGYNQLGEQGGEGSVTGGIMLPAASYDPEEDYYATDGGGILVEMPDCALFELYASQSLPEMKFEFYVAKEETDDYSACKYLWDDDPYYNWSTDEYEGGPVITEYAGPYLNIQDLGVDYDMGEGNPDVLCIFGPKGEPRTAYIANYTNDEVPNSTCPIYIHGLRIYTFTNVSGVEQEGIAAVSAIEAGQNAKTVYYNLQGQRISNPQQGIFIRVNGNKVEKTVIR